MPKDTTPLGSDQFNIVRFEFWIIRENRKAFDLCLRDQYAVEGITVMLGKLRYP